MAQPQEVDGDDQRGVADPGRNTGDIEQRVDRPADRRYRLVDRQRIGEVDLVELVDLESRPALIQPDDVGPELGELPYHVFADARGTSGHDRAASVVAPQLVNLAQGSIGFRYHFRCSCSFARCAAWTRPSLISAMASGISLAVNLPPRPVGRPPNA